MKILLASSIITHKKISSENGNPICLKIREMHCKNSEKGILSTIYLAFSKVVVISLISIVKIIFRKIFLISTSTIYMRKSSNNKGVFLFQFTNIIVFVQILLEKGNLRLFILSSGNPPDHLQSAEILEISEVILILLLGYFGYYVTIKIKKEYLKNITL